LPSSRRHDPLDGELDSFDSYKVVLELQLESKHRYLTEFFT